MSDANKSWGVWLRIVAIFVSGAVIGVLAVAGYVHHMVGRAHSRGPRAFEDVAVELLDWQLDMDRTQEAAVSEIIAEVHMDLLRFKHRHADEIDGILASGFERIEATLTDAQLDSWRSLRTRIEAAHRVPSAHDGL